MKNKNKLIITSIFSTIAFLSVLFGIIFDKYNFELKIILLIIIGLCAALGWVCAFLEKNSK